MEKTLSFLDLPQSLRTRIYTLAGLVRTCPIDFNYEKRRTRLYKGHTGYQSFSEASCDYSRLKRGYEPLRLERGLGCFCAPLPWQLLYISSTIHDEVEVVLYSRNRFSLTEAQDRQSLMNRFDTLRQEDEFLTPLRTLSPQASKVLRSLDVGCGRIFNNRSADKWLQTCNFLSTRVTLRQLSLSLSCETQEELAVFMLQHLASQADLGLLRECAISFGPKQNENLTQHTKSTILRLTGRSTIPAKPFPYAQLPPELRARILYFTELVPIYNKVQWYSDGIEIRQGKLFRPIRKCCATCTPTLAVCSCWCRASAYSSQCTCYAHHFGVFYVSRLMNADAIYTCFSRNRFILGGGNSISSLQFLRSLPLAALLSLRALDLRLYGSQIVKWSKPENTESADWNALVQFIAANCDLPRLHLSLDSGWMNEDYADCDESGDDLEWLRDAYRGFVAPMRKLHGLRRFEVFFSWWEEEEAVAERSVMGEEYDALELGKVDCWRRSPLFPHGPPLPNEERDEGEEDYDDDEERGEESGEEEAEEEYFDVGAAMADEYYNDLEAAREEQQSWMFTSYEP